MKKIILILVTLFSINGLIAQPNTPLAKFEDGNPVFTVDTKEMLSSFTKTMNEVSGINDDFTNVSIIKYESNYILVFRGSKYKSAFSLDVVEGKVAPVDMHITCTTTACSSEQFGCIPTGDVTPTCTKCANGGACTKTTSNRNLFTYGTVKF